MTFFYRHDSCFTWKTLHPFGRLEVKILNPDRRIRMVHLQGCLECPFQAWWAWVLQVACQCPTLGWWGMGLPPGGGGGPPPPSNTPSGGGPDLDALLKHRSARDRLKTEKWALQTVSWHHRIICCSASCRSVVPSISFAAARRAKHGSSYYLVLDSINVCSIDSTLPMAGQGTIRKSKWPSVTIQGRGVAWSNTEANSQGNGNCKAVQDRRGASCQRILPPPD